MSTAAPGGQQAPPSPAPLVQIKRLESMFQAYHQDYQDYQNEIKATQQFVENNLNPKRAQNVSLKNAVVAVYGGNGFIGRRVVDQLAQCADIAEIRVISRDPDSANDFIVSQIKAGQEHLKKAKAEYGDVCDSNSVNHCSHGANAIINLVGIPYESEHSYVDVHITGARNVAHSARMSGAQRVVHVSTLWSKLEGLSRLADTKYRGEDISKASFSDTTLVRCSLVYGKGDNLLSRLVPPPGVRGPIIPPLVIPFLKPVYSSNSKVQPVHVDDVAAGITQCLLQDSTRGQLVELGGSQVVSLGQLVDEARRYGSAGGLLLKLGPKSSRFLSAFSQWLPDPVGTTSEYVDMLNDSDAVVHANNAITFAQLGLQPKSLQEGLAATYKL